MSFLYYEQENEIKSRFQTLKADEIWLKNEETNDYEKIGFGGGGGGELPYYLKYNSIEVDGSGDRETSIYPNNIAVRAVDTTTNIAGGSIGIESPDDNTGSELTASHLIFADTTGNSTLTKAGVDTVSRLQTSETATALANATGTAPIVYNPTTKAFNRSSAIALLSADGNYRTNITPTSFRISLPNDSSRYCTVDNGLGLINENPNYRLYSSANSTGIILRNKITNEGTVTKEDSYTVGEMTSDAISTTGNYSKLGKSSLTFKDSSGTVVLNKDDIGVTNKLKALTTATTGANSKMLIYDTATSAFNYTDLTSAGTIPAWVTTPQALFTQTISGVGKEETTLAGTGLKVFYGSLFNDSNQVTVDDDSVELRKTTTSGANGAYKSLRIDSTGVRLVKKNNGPIATSPEVITTLVAGIVRDSVMADAFAHLTSAFLIDSGSPKCRQYSLAEGETLVLDCFGDASGGIHINEWYAVNLGNQPGSTIIQGFIIPAVTLQNHGYLLFMRNKDPLTGGNGVTIPVGSVIFKIVNTGITGVAPFNGSLCFKMVCSDTSKLPTALFTEL